MVRITAALCLMLMPVGMSFAEEPMLHAVIVVDTHSNVGQFVQIDKHNALRTIHGGFRDANQLHRLSMTVLEGQTATPQNAIAALRALKPAPNDTVLFYYAGHGASEQGRGHFLRMSAGKLTRKTLKQEIDRHNVRLKVILTESCSNMMPASHFAMKPGVATGDWEKLSRLFFAESGTVDVNSCRPGQIARAGGGTGAFWTYCLSNTLCSPSQEPVTWQSVLNSVSTKLEQFIPRNQQTVCVYSMAGQNDAVAGTGQPAASFPPQFSQPTPPPAMPQFTPPQQLPMPFAAREMPPAQWAPNAPDSALVQADPSQLPPPPPGVDAAPPSGSVTIVCIYPPRE